MPRVSIVLPVYNVERFLPYCLETIREQTFDDIEIICVDDGSTDRSASLLAMAAACDDRIRIVTKPNGGLSSARNAGLAVATGDIVMFIDSDDFLDKKACAKVVAGFGNANTEIVTFGGYAHPAAMGNRWLNRTLSPRKITYEGFSPDLLFKESSRPFVWRSAFSRAFLEREGLGFDEEVKFGEDQVFYFAAYPLSRRTVLIPDRLYHYRVSRPESLMASRFQNRQGMMIEHQHIARVILEGWRDRGWLEQHRGPMLTWVLDFLAGDAIGAKLKTGRRLRTSLAVLLREFFPAGPWLADEHPLTRVLYRMLSGDERLTTAARKAALLAWHAVQKPKVTALNLAERGWYSWPALKIRGVLWRIFPPSGRTHWIRLRDLHDRLEDDFRRGNALQMLEAEWLTTLNGPQGVARKATPKAR